MSLWKYVTGWLPGRQRKPEVIRREQEEEQSTAEEGREQGEAQAKAEGREQEEAEVTEEGREQGDAQSTAEGREQEEAEVTEEGREQEDGHVTEEGRKIDVAQATEDEPKEDYKISKHDPKQPGIIQCNQSHSNSVDLTWEEPQCVKDKVQYYDMKYKIKGEKRWSTVTTTNHSNWILVKGLKSNTCYEFKVRAIFDNDEEGPFSEICGNVKTTPSVSENILREDWKVKDGQPATYKLPLTIPPETVNINAKSRKCVFGEKLAGHSLEKTIIVVGATGCGKSTLINGMVNYIFNVAWEDKCRFTIIDLTEDEKQKISETESQTEWITCYTVNRRQGSQLNYTLNIIDTPGFGDTRGIQRDQEIVAQIRELFTTSPPLGIQALDAVCFVAQAPLVRLTPHQRYIFDSVLSIFGNDISKNIFVLMTFADGNEPPIKKALETAKVPFEKAFKFNNSALFVSTDNTEEAQIGKMFWNMGYESFNVFFTELCKTETKSLQLTAEVLKTRQQLEATIQGLQPQIHEGLDVINTIKQEKRVIDQHKAEILANKKFEYEVEEIHMKRVCLEAGTYVTNCLICNRTCHYPCAIPNNDRKRSCAAMNIEGFCNSCPKHCFWNEHVNNPDRIEYVPVKVKKTSEDLKKKYDIARDEEKKHSHILQKVKNKFNQVGKSVFAMIKRVRDCINELNQKAIKQNPLSQVEYIEILIEAEKSEARYGWQKRVEIFQTFKKQAELMKKIPNEEFKPWTEEEVEALLAENEDYKSWI